MITALVIFLAALVHCVWVLRWRCREANLFSDVDGITMTARGFAVALSSIVILALAGIYLLSAIL